MKNRIIYLDLLRIISVLAVIMIHITYKGIYVTCEYRKIFNLHLYFDICCQYAVPIFIMITGYLHLSSNNTNKKFIALSLKYLILYFAVSACYALYNVFYINKTLDIETRDLKNELLKRLFTGEYHLWFLPALAGLYILTPLIREIIKSKYSDKLIIISLFIWILLNAINIFGFYFSEDYWYSYAFRFIQNLRLPVYNSYVGFYILGHYIGTHKIQWYKQLIVYLIGIISLYLSIYFSQIAFRMQTIPNNTFLSSFSPFTIFISISIFVFFKEIIGKLNFNKFHRYIIILLSNCTFWIYLIHVFIISKLEKIDKYTTINPKK